MSKTVTLLATDLMSKWGFMDGDLIEYSFADELDELGLGDYLRDPLPMLVEQHLVPLLPAGRKTYRISSSHNPIRLEYDPEDERAVHAQIAGILVVITLEQVIEVARQVLAVRGAARP